ncbi:MAG: class I SAM-dependent methyltransferase [Chloroflexi bacterium]|nr:class I SAM-dependent methyltransferase [Chloroflexota bacterium]
MSSVDHWRLLAVLPLRPYHAIAHLRGGTSPLTVPFAKYLFDGRVYVLEPSPEALDSLRKRLAEVRVTNVDCLLGSEQAIPLAKESVDGVLTTFVLQEEKESRAVFEQVWQILKPSGWLAIIVAGHDGAREKSSSEPPSSVEAIRATAKQTGFRYVERRPLVGNHELVVLRR